MVSGEASRVGERGAQGFPAGRRLRRRPEYLHAYESGRRLSGRLVVVFACPGEGPGPRLGVTVTKKVGSAVVRNRLRRRVREIFRRTREVAAARPCDVVVNVSPRAATTSFAALRAELEPLLVRATRSLA
jgi:ribonuclease P protein component